MVSRPLQIATVGERTFSITRLNGSVTPVASRSARCWISGSNLEKRSVISNIPCPFVSSEVETPVSTALCRGSSRLRSIRPVKRGLTLQFLHSCDDLADLHEPGLLCPADVYVIRSLKLCDPSPQRQDIP